MIRTRKDIQAAEAGPGRSRVGRGMLLSGLVMALVTAAAIAAFLHVRPRLRLQSLAEAVPADGGFHAVARLRLTGLHALVPEDVTARGAVVRFSRDHDASVLVELRSPVNTGALRLDLAYRRNHVSLPVRIEAADKDSFGDGTPDFLRLHTTADRAAFRMWFAGLADLAAGLAPDRLPKEINDCAALLRWCYRNALHAHDEAWLSGMPLESVPPMLSISQYAYPFTPLGAALFRTRADAYASADLRNGAFAQFADAHTLWQKNTFFVTRNVRAARRGDLLFYRQLEQNSPYHSMILTGDSAGWVVYHTGPIGDHAGEMRRVAMDDLLRHPDMRWRPVPENSNFLGVYRWNILREDPR